MAYSITDRIRVVNAHDNRSYLFYVLIWARRRKTRSLNCRHNRVRGYILILSIMACCTITRMLWISCASLFPHDEQLKYRTFYEVHCTALSGHIGLEKTYGLVSQIYWWLKLYKWVSTYMRTFETFQRVKPSVHVAALLASLPASSGYWEPISMDFVFGLPKDSDGKRVLWSLSTFWERCIT